MIHENVRKKLSERLAELENRESRVVRDLRQPGDRDWTERATQIENDEVLEGLAQRLRTEIDQLKSALERIDSEQYGICSSCGNPISEGRLEAVPYEPTCIQCAE